MMQELIEIPLEKGNYGMAKRASLVFSFYVSKYLVEMGYKTLKVEPHNWLGLKMGKKPILVLCSFYPHSDFLQMLQKFDASGTIEVLKAYPENFERGKTLYLYLYSVRMVSIQHLPKKTFLAFPFFHREMHDIILVVDNEGYAKIIRGKQKKKKRGLEVEEPEAKEIHV